MFLKEQHYIDLLFKFYPLSSLNNSPTTGSTLGFKHKPEFVLNRKGKLNPIFNKTFASVFIIM